MMRPERCMLMAVLALALGFVTPVWASHTADPLEEHYFAHVLPFYKVDAGWQAFAVFADTSFQDPATGCTLPVGTHCTMQIHLYFFNQDCSLVRDAIVPVSDNGVAFLNLNSVSGIPNEGVIFADTGTFSDGGFQRFLAYLVLFNPVDNTTTRIESIPFSPALGGDTSKAHWTRYDAFNTIAITLGDQLTAPPPLPNNPHPPPSGPRTTLMLFNALGGGVNSSGPTVVGAVDTLREFMIQYGRPRSVANGATGGDWVTSGFSATTNVTPGFVELDAFDGAENFLGSFLTSLRCFERVRLGTVLPVLATPPGLNGFFGHVVAFSLVDAQRTSAQTCGPTGRCSFSGFQETVQEGDAVDMIFSGYVHHSSADDPR